jgi:predicted nucleotidyltransferase component of viral defense system
MMELLFQRMDTYTLANKIEEEYAIREIVQEIVLYALFRGGFFKVAAFQGGTSLRIVHGMQRFSEDLDFILQKPTPSFVWKPYLDSVIEVLEEYGLHCEVADLSKEDNNVKKAMVKDSSILELFELSFYDDSRPKKVKIKLEVDINPPTGSCLSHSFLDFPLDYEICCQDLPSNFALKIHALLCRGYLKGRDWFDFNWYIKQEVVPNLQLLQSALMQNGPWEKQKITVTNDWLKQAMQDKISSIDWDYARGDIEKFLSKTQQESLALWGEQFFLSKVNSLK